MKQTVWYRLGKPKEVEVKGEGIPPDTFETVQTVNKVVTVEDGKANFIKMEKPVAQSLEEFRERWPHEPVSGAPAEDEVSLAVAQFTDEQLAAMGLSRLEPEGRSPVLLDQSQPATEPVEVWASEAAQELAAELGISPDIIQATISTGSGRRGLFNTADVRLTAEALQQA